MKMLILLIKAHIKGASGLSKGRRWELKKQNQRWLIPLAAIGIGIALISMGSMVFSAYTSIYLTGEMFGYDQLTIFMAMAVSWVFMLVFSFISCLSILFQAKDLKLLSTLPVPDSILVASRLAIIYGYMMIWNLLLFLPALIVQAVYGGISLWFLIYGLILLLVSPIIPILISALIATLLVRSTGTFRHKTLYEVGVMVIALVAIIGVQALISRMSVDPDAAMAVILAFIDERFASMHRSLPLFAWASEGSVIWWKGSLSVLIILGVSLLLLMLISFRYQRILSNNASTASFSTKKRGKVKGGAKVRSRGVYRALVRKEFDIVSSNSTFLMETVMQVFILPFLLVIFYVTGQIGEISQYLDGIIDLPYLELIVFGVLLLFQSLSSVAPTSISREGKHFTISRLLPIDGMTHIRAKLMFQYLIFFPVYLIYLIFIFLILPLERSALCYMIPGGLLTVAPCIMLGLYIDLKRPLLRWSHPQQAMKQNMNVVISMGVNMLYVVVLGGLSLLGILAGLSQLAVGLCILLISLGITLFVRQRLAEAANGCYLPN